MAARSNRLDLGSAPSWGRIPAGYHSHLHAYKSQQNPKCDTLTPHASLPILLLPHTLQDPLDECTLHVLFSGQASY